MLVLAGPVKKEYGWVSVPSHFWKICHNGIQVREPFSLNGTLKEGQNASTMRNGERMGFHASIPDMRGNRVVFPVNGRRGG